MPKKKRKLNQQSDGGRKKRFAKILPQPSWTGSHKGAIGQHRVYRWICDQDDRCTPYFEDDFTENINWRIFRIMAEFVEGFEFLSLLHKEVTFFGSARLSPKSKYYRMARELAGLCAKGKYTVITGGGPGIMEAANRGAFEAGGESVGLNISLPEEQRKNKYVKKSKGFHYFFTRKVMLSASAQAYVFFPGGFGTLDELFEVVTLIQTGKMSSDVPVILVGKDYWEPLVHWIKLELLNRHATIEEGDVKILRICDSPKEAMQIIKSTSERVL